MIYTFTDRNGQVHSIDMDDKRFRIRPYQQMLSSCSGALLTSLLSEYYGQNQWLAECYCFYEKSSLKSMYDKQHILCLFHSDTVGCS